MTDAIREIRSPLARDVDRVLQECAQAEPDEVLIVYVKGGCVSTLSTGTFSKMRTLGALEILKHDILGG